MRHCTIYFQTDIIILYINTIFGKLIHQNREHFFYSISGYLRFGFYILNQTLATLGFLCFVHVILIIGYMSVVGMLYFFIRDWQCRHLLQQQFGSKFSWKCVRKYLQHNIRCMELLQIANTRFSNMFLVFLAVNLPMNAYIIILLGI